MHTGNYDLVDEYYGYNKDEPDCNRTAGIISVIQIKVYLQGTYPVVLLYFANVKDMNCNDAGGLCERILGRTEFVAVSSTEAVVAAIRPPQARVSQAKLFVLNMQKKEKSIWF